MEKTITQPRETARATSVAVDLGAETRLGDGVVLRATVWRPDDGRPHPVLLQRTPYDRSDSFVTAFHAGLEPLRAARAGFAVVVQDVRGRYSSDGQFVPFVHEAADGAETIEWLRRQPFCDGRVGLYGVSYLGATQLLAATAAPAGLVGIAPSETGSDYYDGWRHQGGAFQLGFSVLWALALADSDLARRADRGEDVRALREDLAPFVADPERAFRVAPLVDLEPLVAVSPAYRDWLLEPPGSRYWRSVSVRERHGRIDVPGLHVGGWHDIFLAGTIENYLGLRDHASTETARRGQRLVVGPWAHAVPHQTVGSLDYGPSAGQAAVDLTDLHLRFFSAVLREAVEEELPPVRIFVMGRNAWRDEDHWPPEDVVATRRYLQAGADRATGALSVRSPGADVRPSTFVYDPHDPVPTCGGQTFLPGLFVGWNAGPKDQGNVEARADVLLFTTEPLERPTELVGPVRVELFASSSAPDTDWTARLADVHPDGTSLGIADGIIRARYRDGFETPKPIEPGRIHRYEIELGSTAQLVPAGHRLRVQISSSNFPRFDRNPNTGGEIATESPHQFVTAHQSVHHDAEHPSAVILPVSGGHRSRGT